MYVYVYFIIEKFTFSRLRHSMEIRFQFFQDSNTRRKYTGLVPQRQIYCLPSRSDWILSNSWECRADSFRTTNEYILEICNLTRCA